VFTGADVAAEELAEALATSEPIVVVIDDGELVREMPAKDELREWIRGASGGNRGVILGGSAAEVGGGFTGWQTDVRNNQRGALLSPRNQFDGDLIGVRIPRSATTAPVVPGRILAHFGDGTIHTLQAPRLVE